MEAEATDLLAAAGTAPESTGWRAVYFAFGDGVLAYDCVECGFQCCRGHGYALQSSELETQFQLRPATRFFVNQEKQSSGTALMRNCPPQCFFLSEGGACQVHVDRGFAAKPETCRHFPFNDFRRVGSWLVVIPHVSLCPLKVVAAGQRSPLSSHSALLSDFAAGIKTQLRRYQTLAGETDSLIALEQRVLTELDSDEGMSSYDRAVVAQLAATADLQGKACASPADAHGAQVTAFCERLRAMLGDWPTMESEMNSSLLRTIKAATPALRARLVFVPEVRDRRDDYFALARTPLMLLALHKIAALTLDAGMSRVTYQTLTRLFSTYRPLLHLVAHASDYMEWDAKAQIDLSLGADEAQRRSHIHLAKQFLPEQQRRFPRTVSEIVSEALGDNVVGRLMNLNRVAERLAGQIVPVGSPPSGFLISPRLKGRLQRWALGVFDESTLFAISRHG